MPTLQKAEFNKLQAEQLESAHPSLILGNPTYHQLTQQVSEITEDLSKTPLRWYIAVGITGSITVMLLAMLTYLALTGIGVLGFVTPLGGLTLIAGWAVLAAAALKLDET